MHVADWEILSDCDSFQEIVRGQKPVYCRKVSSVTSNLHRNADRNAECRSQDLRIWLDQDTGAASLMFFRNAETSEHEYFEETRT